MEVRRSRRSRTDKQQCGAGTASGSNAEEEVVGDKKRDGKSVCREDTEGDDEFAAARARCIGVSDGAV